MGNPATTAIGSPATSFRPNLGPEPSGAKLLDPHVGAILADVPYVLDGELHVDVDVAPFAHIGRSLKVSSKRSAAIAALAGYLLGTMPSADIATRLASGPVADLRTAGSGNPGALNTATVLGARWGVAVLVADMAKGAAAGAVGRAIGGSSGAYVAATASIAGHIVPVWSRGKGGKGVATSAGACLAVFPAYFPIDAAVAATTAVAKRNAESAIRVSSAVWVAAAVVWWRRRLPNAWGPPPTAGLPFFALGGAVMILTKFRLARPTT